MSSRYFVTLLAIAFSLMLFLPAKSYSQVVKTTGNATEASSQLVYYYDAIDGDATVQVTNTNDTEGVWVHVQIFENYDANDASEMVTPVICEERDFIDFLTPNDTHTYQPQDDNFPKNMGESEAHPGEATAIDATATKGFIIITPVVSEADLTAISFQHLIGESNDDSLYLFTNAMGRDAVDFATGEKVADGTPLDGVTNGFVLLQPAELVFNFAGDGDDVDVVGISFKDTDGPAGLLGYAVQPADATWTSFIFDFKEDPTSCGIRQVGCFLTLGLNDTFGQNDTEFIPDSGNDDLLCSGAETPEYDPMDNANFNTSYAYMGWTRIFVSGVSDFENHLGLFYDTQVRDARWMYTE